MSANSLTNTNQFIRKEFRYITFKVNLSQLLTGWADFLEKAQFENGDI